MRLSRGRLYPLLLLLTACGFLWLSVSSDSSRVFGWNGCLIRYLFHIPCPSCGSTRAVQAAFHGEWLLAALMVVVPVWIVIDLLTGSSSFLRAYRLVEQQLQRWPYALTGILAILINWIWNFQKYL